MFNVDVIIIGQGLAGSVLALKLKEKKQSFIIVDQLSSDSSSSAAAGISHPMSFKRLVASWKALSLIPYSSEFYLKIGGILGEVCYEKQKMIRIFSSIKEQNNWYRKTNDEPYNKILKKTDLNFNNYPIIEQFGFGEVSLAGRLNVSKFILLCRKHFKQLNCLFNEHVSYKEIIKKKYHFEYKNYKAKSIVFCEGPKYIKNPFFNYLPNNLNKGELITIYSKNIPNYLLSKGCFSLPINKNEFLIGSTYQHGDFTQKNTLESRNKLEKKLRLLGNFNYKIISQRNGIRPSTIDRRPLIGEHPLMKKMYILNGLGSKGVMLAPYFAQELVDHIMENKAIDPEADIKRFSKNHLHKFNNSLISVF